MNSTKADWKIRSFVYARLLQTGRAPDAPTIAAHLSLHSDLAQASLWRLHAAHALVLDVTGNVLMAHPLSAVPTDYRAFVNGRWHYANCAWDSLGIPAMLGQDAQIEARHPLTRETIRYAILDGQLRGGDDMTVHFALPFRRWYDDILET